MYQDVSNSQDVIDSRDIIARIDDLQSDLDALESYVEEKQTELEEAQEEFDKLREEWIQCKETEDEVVDCKNAMNEAEEALEEAQQAYDKAQLFLDDWDDKDEYDSLIKLQEQCEGYSSDWRYGATLIADHYFEEYAKELAEDIGAADINPKWPYTCIDWEQAAEELAQDYTIVDYDGIDYLIR